MKLNIKFQPAVFSSVALFVSSDETRYALCGILVEIEGHAMNLVATDGRRMIRHNPDWDHDGGGKNFSFIIPKVVIDLLPKEPTYVLWELDFDSDTRELIIDSGDFAIHANAIDGQYPTYKQVIPKEIPTEFQRRGVMLNFEFYADALKALDDLNERSKGVIVSTGEEEGPIYFQSAKTLIILMPMTK